eukprot:TRINITY_DN37533_c0_g1_i1.p1 TRINITY_DN37533_c0_g1~~TRINITY_DN37533_c0_g1_i1.p1  ORF type:complete len:253 (+),score=31.30 TRINITY_DN37533_c0_g1_i1:124-882(+)
MSKRYQIVQFYRSLRDSCKHKKLVSKPDLQPPSNVLTPVESDLGRRITKSVEGRLVNEKLLKALEPQRHPAFCGLATTCVTLRGLGIETSQPSIFSILDNKGFPPIWFGYFGFGFIDWMPHPIKVLLNHQLKYDGLPLSAATTLMQQFGLSVSMFKQPVSRETFVKHLEESLRKGSNSVIVVNYSRPSVQQRGTGHFAPVAAYSPEHDSCLLLEVNSWRYPSVWVRIDVLLDALNTISPGGTRRGFLKVSKS